MIAHYSSGPLTPWIRPGFRFILDLASICAALFLVTCPLMAAPGVTAWLDRDTVPVGDNVILTLSFEGPAPAAAPNLPAFPGLRLLSVGTSTSMSVINNQTTVQTAFNYTYTPTQVGTVIIPTMQLQSNNQIYKTEPLTLKVTKPTELPPDANSGAFLRLAIPKREIFRGEVLPVDVTLYVLAGNNAHLPQLEAAGFNIGNMIQQQQQHARIGNQVYTVVPFKTYVTAVRNGALTLGPATMALQIPAPNARRTLFGDIVDWQRVVLSSEKIPVQVLPLPDQNAPPGFNGAVGSYSLSATVGPTNLSVGDPITVKLQITGKGPLDNLAFPDQPQWREFKTYPASASIESSDPHHLTGSKNFEQVLIPLNHEIKALPPVQFTYFDADLKTYRTLSNNVVPLTIRPSASANVPNLAITNAADRGEAPPVDDILHIKAQIEPAPPSPGPLLAQGWFLAMQAVPLAGWLALLTLRKRNEALANNPKRRRQRQVDAQVQSGLRDLRKLAEEKNHHEFYATLFRLLQEKIGERLDLPSSAITEAALSEPAMGKLPAPTQRELHDLFQACNQAKYASQTNAAELTVLVAKAENAFRELQSLPT